MRDAAAIRSALDADASDAFAALCLDYLDGRLDADAAADLKRQLDADASKRQAFVLICHRGQLMAEALGAASVSDTVSSRERAGVRAGDPVRAARPVPHAAFRVPRGSYALAAALLLLAAAATIYVTLFAVRQPPTPSSRGKPLASVIESTGTLLAGDRIVNSGDEIAAGELSLDGGLAEFRFSNGVAVTLRGATRLSVHDPMSASLARGSVEFDCPPAAKGYTVHLPDGARVVDLGTRFRVEVASDGAGIVRVDEGSVRVEGVAVPQVLPIGGLARISGGRVVRLDGPIAATFDDPALPPTLVASDPHGVVLSDGVARFTGGPVSRRTYLQSVATDWVTRSFVAEAVFQIPDADAWSIPLFGLSDGRIVPTEFDTPIGGPNLLVLLRADLRLIAVYDNVRSARSTDPGLRTIGGARPVAPGVHRLRMTWDASARRATFEWDADADGSTDGVGEFDGSDNGFDADNARIVFGGAGGLRLDSLSIRPTEPDGATETDTDISDPSGRDTGRPDGSTDAGVPLGRKQMHAPGEHAP